MSFLSSFPDPVAKSTPFARSLAIAAVMGATMLVSPLTATRADGTTSAPIQLAQAAAPAKPAMELTPDISHDLRFGAKIDGTT